ncbi:hypothetical protein NX801_08675 [Streptomyces sp. LP05-1]|uniref:Integral membrane protein n=1 Tax=Streptomyces pyxinae TaxID=2970734 RepID=A0ABT2CEE7_9ACTN|nr:hypothetical protein [Streptomyces sp. LP05-1]MCS0635736.1 hypothetical protein [Streptomyces sp. LP05-1]
MPTARHLVNRRRRIDRLDGRPVSRSPDATAHRPSARAATPTRSRADRTAASPTAKSSGRGGWWAPGLTAVVVLLAGLGGYACLRTRALDDQPVRHNTALTDTAATSRVKGLVDTAVRDLFSYRYTDPDRTRAAARDRLTGAAVRQYAALMEQVHAQGPAQRLVLTTTVTDSGVEVLDGGRARLLVFADQVSTRTGKDGGDTVAAAMFAVDAVRQGSTWRIAGIDTFRRAQDTGPPQEQPQTPQSP